MDKYLEVIKDSKEKREAVTNYLKDNNISYTSFDIDNDEVRLIMNSVERFSFEFMKEEMMNYLKEHGLRLSKY